MVKCPVGEKKQEKKTFFLKALLLIAPKKGWVPSLVIDEIENE